MSRDVLQTSCFASVVLLPTKRYRSLLSPVTAPASMRRRGVKNRVASLPVVDHLATNQLYIAIGTDTA